MGKRLAELMNTGRYESGVWGGNEYWFQVTKADNLVLVTRLERGDKDKVDAELKTRGTNK